MPSLTEDQVREALRDCYDPSIPCNIVDLGLVQNIRVTPDADAPGSGIPGVPQKHRVQVDLILTTTAADPAQAHLPTQIRNRLAAFETISHTEVRPLGHPLWTPARITSAGRRILGLDGNPQLIQITARPHDR